ncbi:MAG: TIGR00730 family Rossman fold protein [Planctomycetota bacterium]
MKSITVYCSSSTTLDPEFHDMAEAVGQDLAQRDLTLVYGGGSVGLMGEVADATANAGGNVVGIITEYLLDREQGRKDCDELIVVKTMRERKSLLAERGDGFLILPGGFGTYEEFFEILVGRYLREHDKPIGIVNWLGYFDPFMDMVEHGIRHHFIPPTMLELFFLENDPHHVIDEVCKAAVV